MCDCDVLQSMKEQLSEIENDVTADSKTCTNDDVYEAAKPTLLNMPVEIILKICSFLEPYFLKHTFSKVCVRFADILADDHLWKYWVHSKINGYFPPINDLNIWDSTGVDWEEVCVDMNVETKKWSNVKDSMRHIVVKDVHFASVDTVLLVNNGEICISGGRDRGMALWNVLNIKPHDQSENTTTLPDTKPKYIRDAHTGWVWDLAPDNIDSASKVFSASWDNTVKSWDLATEFSCVQTFRCGTSALSVATTDSVVMTGLFSRKILAFDQRVGPSPINMYKAHKGPVLGLNVHKNFVASVSEDKTLAIWDTVGGKLLFSDVKVTDDKAYPVCISWSPLAMYIGDSKGYLHLFHPEDHSYVKTHQLWAETHVTKPPSKITGCYQTQGTIVVSSGRGEIKFLYNSCPPEEYSSVKTSSTEVTQLRYLNGVMVIGTCDSALEFWVPNEKYFDL